MGGTILGGGVTSAHSALNAQISAVKFQFAQMWGVHFWGGGGHVCANLFFTVEIRAFRPKCADVGGTLLGGGG